MSGLLKVTQLAMAGKRLERGPYTPGLEFFPACHRASQETSVPEWMAWHEERGGAMLGLEGSRAKMEAK